MLETSRSSLFGEDCNSCETPPCNVLANARIPFAVWEYVSEMVGPSAAGKPYMLSSVCIHLPPPRFPHLAWLPFVFFLFEIPALVAPLACLL